MSRNPIPARLASRLLLSQRAMIPPTTTRTRFPSRPLSRPTNLSSSSHLPAPTAGLSAHDRIPTRAFHSQPRLFANYERFPNSRGGYEPRFPNGGAGWGGGNGNGGGSGGNGNYYWNHPLTMALRRRLGGDRGLVIFVVGLGGAGVYYVFHLERVPETGRLRFIDVSASTELTMGLDAQKETLAQYQGQLLSPSNPVTKRVREVARRVVESNGLGRMKEPTSGVESVGRAMEGIFGGAGGSGDGWGWESGEKAVATTGKDVEWEVFVIKDDKTKNAFVLPGGKIFVFTGILPVCKNDDGLASVLGHEVAHQVARHSAERMSSMKVLFVLGYALEALGLDVGFTRLLLTFLLQLPNSRTNESEADHIGIKLMAKACFDPRESTKMWTRMSESEKGGGLQGKVANVDFLSTHPANAKRITALEKWMPAALEVRAASPCGDTSGQYEAFKEHAPLGRTERIWG